MNLNFSQITSRFKKLPKGRASFRKNDEVYIFKDWEMLCAGAFIGGLIISAGGLYLFYQIASGSFFDGVSEEAAKVDTLSRTNLKKVIDQFEQQKLLFEQLKTKPPDMIKP